MGQAVLVTGGSRGLGAALVAAFLDRGDAVATCARSSTAFIEEKSADASLADRFMFEQVDLSDREAAKAFVKSVAERFGELDVLVNNAGIAPSGVLPLFTDDVVDEVVDLNLKGTIAVTRAAARLMIRRGSGRIVNITSVVGLAGYRGLSVYGATKAALDGFTRALARELGPRGIAVNAVAPGYLRTDLTNGLDVQQFDQIRRRTPLGRLGEPEDVAAAVVFLASPEAAWISGQTLVVDGGLSA